MRRVKPGDGSGSSGSGGGTSLASLPFWFRVPGIAAVFDADALALGAVSSWSSSYGSLGTIPFTQGTASFQAANQLGAFFNGHRSVKFDGVNDFLTTSNQNAWKFLHDGTGGSYFVVRRQDSTGPATQQLLLTAALATEVGISHANDTATGTAQLRWRNGTGANLNVSAQTGFSADSSAWLGVSYGSDLNIRRSGGSFVTTNTGSPSSANPTRAMILGTTQTPTTNPFKGEVALLAFWPRVLTAAEWSKLATGAAQRYGVTA